MLGWAVIKFSFQDKTTLKSPLFHAQLKQFFIFKSHSYEGI